jgi:hypothetical protein
MIVKLAFDNDAAGYQAVWRTLQKCISTMYIPFDFDGMRLAVFEAWLPRFCYIELLMIQDMVDGERAEIVEQRLADERRRIHRRRGYLEADAISENDVLRNKLEMKLKRGSVTVSRDNDVTPRS